MALMLGGESAKTYLGNEELYGIFRGIESGP